MNKKTLKLIIMLVATSLILVLSVSSMAFAQTPLDASLDRRYHKISLLANYPLPTEVIYFDVNEETFISHGWATSEDPQGETSLPNWSAMTPQQKNEFLTSASFTLKVNGEPIKLHRIQWYNQAEDGMYVKFWAKFPSNYFADSDILEGYWSTYLAGELLDHGPEIAEINPP